MAKARHSYHHGDLRNALIEAGIAILAEGGTEALTLRAAAAKAGVSHAAPAHHFGSLHGLLTAIAAVGFERFYSAIDAAMAVAPPAPVDRLRAAGQAYVAFAVANPAIIQLMFSGPRLDWSSVDLCAAADRAAKQLSQIVAPAAERLGATSEAQRRELEVMVWSSVHGYAHLAIAGVLDRGAPGQIPPVPDIAGVLFGTWRTGCAERG